MNHVFYDHPREFILVFLDDILVYNPSVVDHWKYLETTLSLFRHNSLYGKLSNCFSALSQVEYLGHIISTEGVQADPSKVVAVINWPQPISVKALKAFLGLTGYYRKFTRNYVLIS